MNLFSLTSLSFESNLLAIGGPIWSIGPSDLACTVLHGDKTIRSTIAYLLNHRFREGLTHLHGSPFFSSCRSVLWFDISSQIGRRGVEIVVGNFSSIADYLKCRIFSMADQICQALEWAYTYEKVSRVGENWVEVRVWRCWKSSPSRCRPTSVLWIKPRPPFALMKLNHKILGNMKSEIKYIIYATVFTSYQQPRSNATSTAFQPSRYSIRNAPCVL